MGVEERKLELRRQMRMSRSSMPADERAKADAAICENLVALEAFVRASTILTYLSFGSEVATRGVIEHAWATDKRVALPRCVDGTRQMRWYVIESFEGLEKNPKGMDEPPADPDRELDVVLTGPNALAIVPGLAYDAHGCRVGYGGGYYDVFLASFAGVSAGLCREAQLVGDLSALGVTESHDMAVDVVVTERRVLP